MAKRMRTTAQIDAERTSERAARLACMTERQLAAWLAELASEVSDNGMDYRLTLNHREIIGQIRTELATRRGISDTARLAA